MAKKLIERCPECRSRRILTDYLRGDFVCKECGAVFENPLRTNDKSWGKNDTIKECPECGSTRIMVIREQRPGWFRCRICGLSFIGPNFDNKIKSYKVKSSFNISELYKLSDDMGLNMHIVDHAEMLLMRITDKSKIKAEDMKGYIAASIYLAFGQCGVPRTLDEISSHSGVDRELIWKTSGLIYRDLNMKLLWSGPMDFIARFCAILGRSENVRGKAFDITNEFVTLETNKIKEKIGEEKYFEREISKPYMEKTSSWEIETLSTTLAGIYIASLLANEKISMEELRSITPSVTEEMIRKKSDEIIKRLKLEVPE